MDTDWAVWWMRGRSEVVALLTSRERDGLAISVVTLAELYEGIENTRDPDAARPVLGDFLKLVTVIPFSEKVAVRFGTEAAKFWGSLFLTSILSLRRRPYSMASRC